MDLLLEGFPKFQLFLHQDFNLLLFLLRRVLAHEELEVVLALTPRLRSHHRRASVASLWSSWLWWIWLLIYQLIFILALKVLKLLCHILFIKKKRKLQL